MDIAEYLLRNLKKNMNEVVIQEEENISNQIKFANNKIVKTGTEQLRNIDIFAVKDKKIVNTSFRELVLPDDAISSADMNLSKKKADEVIKKVIKFASLIQPKEDYYGIADGKFKYKKIKNCYDKKINNMDHVDYVEKAVNSALNEKAKRTAGILESHYGKRRVLTSNNIDVSEKSTNFYFSIRAMFDENASGHINCCSRMLSKFNVEKAGKEAGKIAFMAKDSVEGEEGKYDIIFDPMVLTALLATVTDSLSIFTVESGLSFLADKLNKKVADNNVNVIDDALMENGYGSSSFDDEGRASKKNILIKNGILKTYYHNTSTAKKYNTEPTGNAGLISPSGFNLELVKGKKNREELIKNVSNGILITNIWYTRFNNHRTGDFSTIPRDGMFLIKKGEIVKSLKNLRITDNMLRILENINEIGNNSEQIISWESGNNIKCPSIVVKDVNITKAKD